MTSCNKNVPTTQNAALQASKQRRGVEEMTDQLRDARDELQSVKDNFASYRKQEVFLDDISLTVISKFSNYQYFSKVPIFNEQCIHKPARVAEWIARWHVNLAARD